MKRKRHANGRIRLCIQMNSRNELLSSGAIGRGIAIFPVEKVVIPSEARIAI